MLSNSRKFQHILLDKKNFQKLMGRIGKLRSHPLEIAKLELVGRQNLLNELIQKIQYVMKPG